MKIEEQASVRFAVAEDHLTFRHGLINLLASLSGQAVKPIIQVANGQELLASLEVAATLPDVCLLDISMEPMNAYVTTARIRKRWPEIGIIILTAYGSTENMIRLFDLGANAFLTKNCHPAIIREALIEVKEKGIYLANLPQKLVRDLQANRTVTPQLTATEMQFLQLCASTRSYAGIAACMKTNVTTVYGYRNRLFEKLNINSRVSLALYAISCGFMPQDFGLH